MKTPLRQKREESGMRLCDFALHTGLNYSNLCMYEKGYLKPNFHTAEKLASALGCNAKEIFPNQKLRGE